MTSRSVNSPSLLSRWLKMSLGIDSLGIKHASSQGCKGLRYNKFLCQFLSDFSPVATENGGGDDFAWKQLARIALILIFF